MKRSNIHINTATKTEQKKYWTEATCEELITELSKIDEKH